MRATDFPEATAKLLPPEGEEDKVYELPIWRHPDGGMVISKWKMTWRERMACLIQGHVWFHSWGNTHPPVTIATMYPFEREAEGLIQGIKWALLIVFVIASTVGSIFFYLQGSAY